MAEKDVEKSAGRAGTGNTVKAGNIRGARDVTIAGGDIHQGYSSEQVAALLAEISTKFKPRPFDGRCPYKGLDYFEEEDAGLFFGREKLVEDLTGRVEQHRILFVTGPSGSGKSSLARAGLIHALKQGCLKGSERWLYGIMKPGREPVAELARVTARLAGSTNAEDEISARAATDPTIFRRWCEIALGDNPGQRVVLFIDQFEEIFTQINRERASLFIDLLAEAAGQENGRVILLFAMRSDFVSNCAAFPKLNALYNRQPVQIGAMQPPELVSAIAQPALRVGLRIDPELITQIIADMKGEPGALPLMQFALKDLFDAGQTKDGVIALTLESYLQRGGISKALERHADHSFQQLSPHEQELARLIFSGLIEVGRGTQDTRRTAYFDDLVSAGADRAEVEITIRKLADARLITTDEIADKDTVTISHEKLIEAWSWLKKLVDENRDVIALQNVIGTDAKVWEEHGRDASYLYSGARLALAQEQLLANKITLSGTAENFIEEGIARQEADRRARESLRRRVTAGLIAGILVALSLAGFAFFQQREAQKQATVALARQLAAQGQSMLGTAKQMTGVLLSIKSMQLSTIHEAAQVLLNNNFAGRPISSMTHDDAVSAVAVSPDGKYVVSGSIDGSARVWEAATGKEIAHITHGDIVNSLAFSPDGKYVLSGSDDGTALVWEAATGKEIARMLHQDPVPSVAFSPDGKYAASAGADGTARLWEAATGREVARMTHDNPVNSVAFSPDGKYVLSAGNDSTARVWEVATGQEVARMTEQVEVNSAAFSPDGKYVVSASYDGIARVWDAATGQEIAHMNHEDILDLVDFSPDGKYVLSGSYDGTARIWEAATGKEVARTAHDDSVSSIAFSPDGKYVLSGSLDGTARVWEAATGREVARMTHDGAVTSVAFSPDGKFAVSGSDDKTARTWQPVTDREAARMTHDEGVYQVAFSPDGKFVLSGSTDGTARVWDAATGREIAHMMHDFPVTSLAFSPDGKYVLSGSNDGTAQVWEADTSKERARMDHGGTVTSVAFSPDGKYALSGSEDGTARVWEAITGREVARMAHDNFVNSVAFSPDGKYVLSGSNDGTARVWDAATGKEVAQMAHGDSVYRVAFSPDGKYVLSGSVDGTARVWEAATGKEKAHMTHEDAVYSLAFSPDGKYVVSGSADGTARVWQAATGSEVARMIHDGTVFSTAFSPDGKFALSGSDDKTTRVWYWQAQDLIQHACANLPRDLTRAEWEKYIGDALPYQAICENLPIETEAAP